VFSTHLKGSLLPQNDLVGPTGRLHEAQVDCCHFGDRRLANVR
jgi:hypothetical protein